MRVANAAALISAAAMLTSLAGVAGADPVETQALPQCKVYRLAAGGEVCGFPTEAEVRLYYKADAELVELREKVALEQRVGAALELAALAAGERADAEAARADVHKRRAEELRAQWIETDRQLQNERVKPRWGVRLTWGTASLAAGLLVGYLAGKL